MTLLLQSSLARRQEQLARSLELTAEAYDIFAENLASFGCARTLEFTVATYLRKEYFHTAQSHYANALRGYRQIDILIGCNPIYNLIAYQNEQTEAKIVEVIPLNYSILLTSTETKSLNPLQ